jgi:polyisoprenoid-binding protein YceI
MKKPVYFCAFVSLAMFIGCSNPADSVPKAEVASNSDTSTAKGQSSSRAARTYVFNADNSSIEWVGSKVTGKHDGGFKKFDGELHVVDGHLTDTGNKVVIDTTSLWADNDRLTGHLKSPDFFNVNQMPTATFETTAIAAGATNSTVTGNLTLHGVTKQISFPANIQINPDTVELGAQFVLNRFDFEIKYPGKANDLIRKEVILKLKLKAVPAKA